MNFKRLLGVIMHIIIYRYGNSQQPGPQSRDSAAPLFCDFSQCTSVLIRYLLALPASLFVSFSFFLSASTHQPIRPSSPVLPTHPL